MPPPMVHLAIAVEMYGVDHNSDFLLGNIAPDAIHMRPNTERKDKLKVHLADLPKQRYERARQLFTQYRADNHGSKEIGFADGYITHLLTDFLWQERVIKLFYEQVPPSLTHHERRKLYYQETDGNDFNLYHQMPWREAVWTKLSETTPLDFGPFLTSDEISKWRDRVLKWFEDIEELKIEPIFVSYEKTLNFINQASSETKSVLEDWKSFID